MFEKEFGIAELIYLHQEGQLDVQQREKLDAWLSSDPANRVLFSELMREESLQAKLAAFDGIDEQSGWQKVKRGIAEAAPLRGKTGGFSWFPRVAVAAAVLIFLGLGLYFYLPRNEASSSRNSRYANDILPGTNGATIKMANGHVIALNGSKSGVLISPVLKYADHSEVSSERLSGTVEAGTGRGQTYRFTLPDGTTVWLNAGSKLVFPVQFGSHQRSVSLTGEAYFDVATDKKRPFVVMSKGQKLEVLGTRFNLNAYDDEDVVTTSLLEGSVRIVQNSSEALPGSYLTTEVLLKPGEKAVNNNKTIRLSPSDAEEALAWKNGYFRFNDEPIGSIMRKLSRWYDIEVDYEGTLPREGFNGKISRNNNISEVLNALERTETARFKIEGRRVTVMQ